MRAEENGKLNECECERERKRTKKLLLQLLILWDKRRKPRFDEQEERSNHIPLFTADIVTAAAEREKKKHKKPQKKFKTIDPFSTKWVVMCKRSACVVRKGRGEKADRMIISIIKS